MLNKLVIIYTQKFLKWSVKQTVKALEYFETPFSIADSIYGSTFFVATGFHGLHVIIGTLFLAVCLYRILDHHFTQHHHNGFEASI